jgi:MYXO-CTERM domain-containing protein
MRAALGLGWFGIGLSVALFASRADAQAAPAFPADSAWVPLRGGGIVLGDPLNDAQGSRDIVGDSQNGAAFLFRDATHLFFRLRLDANPQRTPTDYESFAWGVEFDVGTTAAYEYLAMVNGIDDRVLLLENTTPGAAGDPRDLAETELANYPVETHARSVQAGTNFGGNPDYFIDWAINIQDLVAAGLDLNAPIRFIFGTSTNKQLINTDFLSPTSETTIDNLGTDPVDCSDGRCQTGCTSDADCADAARPACQPSGACGECSAANTALCTAGQQCNVASGTCGGTCTSDADCGGAEPACQPSGICGQCSSGNAALCTGTRPVCDTQAGICVGSSTGAGGGGALTEDDVEVSGSGCACRAPAAPADAGMLAVIGAGALVAFARRRRRAR